MTRPPHRESLQPLQKDIRLLGTLLGEVICAHEGKAFFDTVERMRRLAFRARAGGKEARARMEKRIAALPDEKKYKVVKAFTGFLQMANVAEQTHRIRRRLYYRRAGRGAQPSSPADMFARLRAGGASVPAIRKALAEIEIELVLTAHPTEAMPPDTVRAHRDLSALLLALDGAAPGEGERDAIMEDMRGIMTRQWLGSLMRADHPRPQDEALYGLRLAEDILWEAVPRFFRDLRCAARDALGDLAGICPCPVRFASWMGGDRDGHPGVTARVTREVLDMSRLAARRLYAQEISAISAKLAFDPDDERDRRAHDRCRARLLDLRRRLDKGMGRAEFMERLDRLKGALEKSGLWPLVERDFQDLVWRVRVFGSGLLCLDIRQDAGVHAAALGELLPGYGDMGEKDRARLLLAVIAGREKPPRRRAGLSAATREVLDTMALLAAYPAELFGACIISMAEKPSDVLAAYALMKIAGVKEYIPACPLFETPASLAGAAEVMKSLYALPAYRRLVGGRQEIMVGYSDSGKRGGYIKSAWEIYTLQSALLKLGARHGIRTTFFHGRGGTIARGGGPIGTALLALPRPLDSRRIRVTEQGEVINSKFGLPGVAVRTMEIYTAGFMSAVLSRPARQPARWRAVMRRLAARSEESFRAGIYDNADDFMAHYEQITPVRELKLLKIGSRPARRGAGGGLDGLRAIPWVFSWTQARAILPAWKGIAAALDAEIKAGNLPVLRRMYREWPFFLAVIDLLEMAVAKADPQVTRYYSDVLVEERLRPLTDRYLRELQAVQKTLLRITGRRQLLETNPVLRRSIALRTPYVDVINIIQAHVLRQCRATRRPGTALTRTLALTFSGISAGMRNTG